MKTTFQRLHRTAFIAFPLTTVLLLLNLSLFGELSTVMLVIWGISIGLLAVVLLACIAQNANRRFRAGEWKQMLLRHAITAAVAFAVLTILDQFADKTLWLANAGAALGIGLLSWYQNP